MPDNPTNAILQAALKLAGLAARAAGVAVGAALARLRRRDPANPAARFSVLNAEFLQGSLLFLAAAIAGIAADGSASSWSLLVPPLIAIILLVVGLFDPRARFSGLGLLGVAGIAFGSLLARLWAGALGPLPFQAFRDAVEAFACLSAAAAFWIAAMQLPAAAHAAWVAALAAMFLARLPLDSGSPLFRPDLLPILLSGLWGFVALGGALHPPRAASERRGALAWHVAAVAFGAFVGWVALRHSIHADLSSAPEARQSLLRGRGELAGLWSRSILFGWGRAGLGRVGEAFAAPLGAEMPRWLGWIGSLAMSGLASAAGAAALSVAVAAMAAGRASRGAAAGSATQQSLLAAQFLLGLWAAGGPNSAIPGLLAAGWLALGLAAPLLPPAETAEPDDGPGVFTLAGRYTCSLIVVGALILACFGAAAPIYSARFVARHTNPEAIKDPRLNRKIYRARAIFPWNPEIYTLEAARLRQQLDDAQGWNETLYQRVCQAYERAIATDPLDPLLALKLVRVQMLAKRLDDAKATALRAMRLNPRSEELPEALYAYATANGQPDLAIEMVRRGMEINPASPSWRWRLYQARQTHGRGEQSAPALHAALTSDPANLMFFRAAMGQASAKE